MAKILIVDDEQDIIDLIALHLKKAHYEVFCAGDGLLAIQIVQEELPDLIILDLMLPQKDGYAVFQELRDHEKTCSIPVIMLTAKGSEEDRVKGLELGADDYVTKPFSPKELTLRVQTVLKRAQWSSSSLQVVSGPFLLEKESMRFLLKGKPVEITLTEYKLLKLLIEREGEAQDRYLLLKEVWGYGDLAYSRTLDTHVKRLRGKLGQYADYIETVRGVGYRFVNKLDG